MSSSTIKLFLINGSPKRLRTAEISNWTGKVVCAPRTELDQLLSRPELQNPVEAVWGGAPDREVLPVCTRPTAGESCMVMRSVGLAHSASSYTLRVRPREGLRTQGVTRPAHFV